MRTTGIKEGQKNMSNRSWPRDGNNRSVVKSYDEEHRSRESSQPAHCQGNIPAAEFRVPADLLLKGSSRRPPNNEQNCSLMPSTAFNLPQVT